MVSWVRLLHGKNGELIASGWAVQSNTPINVKALEDMWIMHNIRGW